MKRIFSLCITLLLIFTISSVNAAPNQPLPIKKSGEAEAILLKHLNLFKGVSQNDFDLYRKPTRLEGIVMLIRLLGEENLAKGTRPVSPFNDVPNWGKRYVAYAYKKGYTKGVSKNKFAPSSPMSAKAYLTFTLRALGYSDSDGDFTYNNPFGLANRKKLLFGLNKFFGKHSSNDFLRNDVAIISTNALNATIKNTNTPLVRTLFDKNAISLYELYSVGGKIQNVSSLPKSYKIIRVKTVEEFFKAIGNNTIVLLDKGVYDITPFAREYKSGIIKDMRKVNSNHVSFTDVNDGLEATLSNLKNFHIVGTAPKSKVEIICRPRYADVIEFKNCYNCTISNVTMGHTPDTGYCTGAVIQLSQTNNFGVNNSVLYGCGTYGVSANNSNNIFVYNNEIKECSYNALSLHSSKNIDVLNCYIHDNYSYGYDLKASDLPVNIYNSKNIKEAGNIFSKNYYPD